MKQHKLIITSFVTILMLTGCKKFLALDPLNNLSGNNFWRDKNDVEAFTNGNYELLRNAVSRKDLTAPVGNDEFPFFIFSGDFRGAPIVRNPDQHSRIYIDIIRRNDIKGMNTPAVINGAGRNWYGTWNVNRFTEWDRFFDVISSANIAHQSIDNMPSSALNTEDKKRYMAEAIFLRCFTYFLMVRQWGDVPYYTTAFQSEPLGRTLALEVLKKCIAELSAVKNNLPWTYNNPAYVAVRGMRGSALDLLMHLNMWCAFFDKAHANDYYTAATQYGEELYTQNQGNYTLLPLARTSEIFKGRSKEGLFEIPQNKNYNESFGWSTYYDHTKKPAEEVKKHPNSYPYIWYTKKYMEQLFPAAIADGRKTTWYDPATIYNDNNAFYITKFLINKAENEPETKLFDASQTVFRYAEALLLYAEALAELGQDIKAKKVLNEVRTRAQAPPITTSGETLRDDIFWERQRETMGEGHYWYDMVRTRRILSNEYGYKPAAEDFNAGCWTWPISHSALTNNPRMKLNTYWE